MLPLHPEIVENLVKIAQDSGKEKGRKVKAINKNTQEVLMFDSIKEFCIKRWFKYWHSSIRRKKNYFKG